MPPIETNPGVAALILLVWALAIYRITRLLVFETILGRWPELDPETGEPVSGDRGTGLRKLVDLICYRPDGEARSRFGEWLGELATCTFCMGVWVSVAVAAGWVHGGEAARWVIAVAAVAGVAGYLNSRPGA